MIAKFYRFMVMAMVAGSLLLPGCKDDDLNGSLSFSEDNLLLKAAGDTMVVAVTAGSNWKAESQADWCTVEKESAEKLIVRVAPSDDIYERGTAVKITCGDNVVRLSVRQEPMLFEVVDEKKALDFKKQEGATDVLKIHTNMAWKVEITDTTGWLQVVDTAGLGDAELMFTVSDNSQKGERKTTVRLRYGVRTLKLTATQEGGIRVDGHAYKHYGEREVENGYNLIFLGEGFVKEDLIAETGAFDQAVTEACEFLFNVEPYKTYKEYINVFSVACVSKERGVASLEDGKSKNTAFYSVYDSEEAAYFVSPSVAWGYALKVMGMTEEILQKNTCVVLLVNDERYGGNTWWYSDGRTLCVVPLNRDTQLPGGFTNIFLHEVGGHGIGKLADAWSDDALLTAGVKEFLEERHAAYYCLNIGLPTGPTMLSQSVRYAKPWNKLWSPLYTPEEIDARDGGYGFVSDWDNRNGVSHCEERSCMIDHSTYFDRASRYGIYHQLMSRTGTDTNANVFKENDVSEVPEAQPVSDRPRLMKPVWVDLTEEE
ncbi:MAG: hypothetical protein K2I90_08715 [Odoribacter sp.]|nr:hypothetical protein [Odoribacter sp.]